MTTRRWQKRASMDHFLREVYNEQRLHSALGYLPLVEFEQIPSPTWPALPLESMLRNADV